MLRFRTFALIQVLLLAFVATGSLAPSVLASGDDSDELHGTVETLPGSGFIGDISGWFNRGLRQFKSDQFDNIPTQYMPREAYA